MAKVYDGEGLPPVGCECEVDWSCGGDWRAVKIIHYSGGKIWVRDTRGDHIIWEDATFRPIRSEEDIAVDRMISDAGLDNEYYNLAVCRDIYRVGYRKTRGECMKTYTFETSSEEWVPADKLREALDVLELAAGVNAHGVDEAMCRHLLIGIRYKAREVLAGMEDGS